MINIYAAITEIFISRGQSEQKYEYFNTMKM